MADEAPNKNDIQLIFKRLRSVPTNKVCFDCNAKNPTWSSVTYGVFICIDCSAVHRSLGVHLTFVRSTQLDTNWTWLQLRQMQLGGNANADLFFRQHNCITTDAQQKYNSRAAQLYREKLHTAAIQAMRLHGSKLHLEVQPEGATETKKEVDFFEEHTSFENDSNSVQDINSWTPNGNISLLKASLSGGPNVTAALSTNSQAVESSGERKPTIGLRKGPVKKPGLGSKKGAGLGAQRVKANFAELEREAELADQLRMQEAIKTPVPEKSLEEQETQMASMRLAYQDLSLKHMKDIQNCKDPKKAQQMERLGMGIGSRTGVSHSAISDMKVIEQESPIKNKPSKSMFDRDNDGGFDDFFDSFSGSNSGFSMYKGSRTPTEPSFDSILFDGNRDHLNCSSDFSKSSKNSSIWSDNKSSSDGWGEIDKKNKGDWGEPERRQPKASSDDKKSSSSASNEAQKKFGSAKAISSDQFFSDFGSDSLVSERKSNLSRFEGSSSISSAEYFGRGESSPGYGSSLQTPDLEDVKESVRQGVTKVAGKLSSLANGVMSSIQEKYGGY